MIYRLIDVNINRIKESLRLLEDICRFIFNDRVTTTMLKNYRHKIVKFYSQEKYVLNRDVEKDTAKFLNIKREFNRDNLLDVISANL